MTKDSPRTVEELIAVLENGDDDAVVGVHESTWFDAKSGPYQLDNAKHVWELAKDVSAMSNVGGGVILIGAKTERTEGSLVEYVSEMSPIPANRLMMADRVHDLLRDRLWPPLGSRVSVRQFERSDGRALQAVVVEAAPPDSRPVLVRSRASIEFEGMTHELDAWGSARRVGSGTEWEPIEQLWADIRDGRTARRNLTLPIGATSTRIEERLAQTIALLAERVGRGDRAALVLAAYPDRELRLAGFHQLDGIRGALEKLPDRATRRDGFGLGYGVSVDSLDGGLAVIEAGRRGLLVERDGLVVAMALGTSDMLGWAHAGWETGHPLRINRFVLVEWPLEFARFVEREVAPGFPNATWTYEVRGLGLQLGNPPLEASLSEPPLGFSYPAIVDSPDELIDATGDPELDAFAIVQQILGWFGIDTVDHPWITDGRVSEAALRSAR